MLRKREIEKERQSNNTTQDLRQLFGCTQVRLIHAKKVKQH